jgi:5-bromo-4-chloroindolyl phosphate hydrolysis protein
VRSETTLRILRETLDEVKEEVEELRKTLNKITNE